MSPIWAGISTKFTLTRFIFSYFFNIIMHFISLISLFQMHLAYLLQIFPMLLRFQVDNRMVVWHCIPAYMATKLAMNTTLLFVMDRIGPVRIFLVPKVRHQVFFVREWFNNILRRLYSFTYYLLHVGSKIDICCMKDLITFLPKLIL